MAAHIRSHDWKVTSLGPIDTWPQNLRSTVQIMLASDYAMQLAWGADRTVLYNGACAPMLGQRHPQVLGATFAEAWPDVWGEVAPLVEKVFAGETVRAENLRLEMTRKGHSEETWWTFALSPVRGADGGVAGLLNVMLETTPQVRAQEAEQALAAREADLREREARQRLLLGSWAQAIWESDPEGVVVKDSPSWRAYTGQTREEWLGYGWLDAIHPEDRAYAEHQWREAVAARDIVDAEFRMRAPGGGWRWTNVRAAPVMRADGTIEKWTGINIDIDAAKRAEHALRESEKKYRDLFNSMDEAYAVVDVLRNNEGEWFDFRFVEVNNAFLAHSGMPWPVGKTSIELLGTPNPRWAKLYGEALDTGRPMRVEEGEATLGRVFDLNIFALDRARSRVAVLFTDITERKRTEAALRESEERRAFLLSLSDTLTRLTAARDIMAEASRLTGEHLKLDRCGYGEVDESLAHLVFSDWYTAPGIASFPAEVSLASYGERLTDAIASGKILVMNDVQADPDVPARAKREYAAAGIAAFVGVPLMKDGHLVAILSAHQSRPRDWGEAEIGLLGEVLHRTAAIIERARAEARVRQSEERLQSAVSISTVGVIFWDADGRIIETNGAFLQMSGFAPEEAEGRSWQELTPPEFHAASHAFLEELEATGEGSPYEKQYLRADGSRWWGLFAGRKLRDGFAEFVIDITDTKHAQQQLAASEKRLQAAIEVGKLGLWDWDVASGKVVWSDEHFRLEGYEVGEVVPSYRAWADRIHPDDREATEAALNAAMEHMHEFGREFRVVHPDGSVHWLNGRGRFFYDEAGRPLRMIGAIMDTTERRTWEERQEVLISELQHRTFNLLGVVRSVSGETARSSRNIAEFSERFHKRIDALARVQRHLSRLSTNERITFEDLIEGELEAVGALPPDPSRLRLEGPRGVELRSASVQTFAMALHELVTNALKHGALGQDGARLSIVWQVEKGTDGHDWLALDWQEYGVEMEREEASPPGTGQGRSLIEEALPFQLGARTSFEMGEDGIRCRIALPVSGVRSR